MTNDGAGAPERPFFVYAENWPGHDGIPTTGLDRALVPIVSAILPWQPTILLAPRTLRHVRHTLHPVVKPIARRASLLAILLDELRTRRQRDYDGTGYAIRQLRAKIGAARGILFSVLGGDARAYVRAATLAQSSGLAHVIYTVDDPFAWADERQAQLPLLQALKPRVTAALGSASAVTAITAGLAETLSAKSGRTCVPLALPYMEPPALADSIKRQLMYVGNMSHLYRDSFVQVIASVERRRAAGDDLTLRVTFPATALDGIIDHVPDFMEFGPINERQDLLTEIAESLAAVCPIAFDPAQDMVRTSFPSKMLDYLGNARVIIVHGPIDSVAARYLSTNGLPYVTSSPVELDRTIEAIMNDMPDHRDAYSAQLNRAHGGEAFRETLASAIRDGRGE